MEWCSIVQPLLDYVVKPVCSFAKMHISYVACKSKLIDGFTVERQKLEDKKMEIEMRVTTADGEGKEIVPQVSNWLKDAGTLIKEVDRILEQEKLNSDNKCGFNRCFCSIGNRYKTGKGATNMLKTLKEKLKEASEPCFIEVGIPRHSPPAPMALPPTAYSKGYASRESLLEKIIEALKVKNMIGIYGMAGVGKTVLVERLAAEVKSRHLFDEVGTAVVSQTPDLAVIRNVIADRILHAKLDANSEEGKKDKLTKELETLICQEKVLLILDDAWEPLELHKVGIPCQKKFKGFKIVVTSRFRPVCARMGAEKIFEVHVLSKPEAWSLFRQELGDSSRRIDTDEGYKVIAEEMVGHFGGLPLALVTLARALIEEELPAWRDIARYLRERSLHEIDGMSDKVIGAIQVSFDYLHHKNAQFIFLLCCLFPEDWNIEVEVLMRYGIGLGLFRNLTIAQAMDGVERLTEMLKSRSLLLEGDNKRTVKMHDVIRYTALHIASKGEFDFLVKDYCGSRIDAISHDMLIKKCAISISSKTSIMDVFPQDHMMEYFNLQILRLQGIKDSDEDFLPHEFSTCFFEGMVNLKVLEVCHMEISSFPTSLGPLKNNLRIMCLRDCIVKDFTKVGELTNLEILDMQGSRIYGGLYEAIQQMIGLRVLDLTSCRANELLDNLAGHLSRLFTKLEQLILEGLPGLKEICAPSQYVYLSKLNYLTIRCCKMLPFAFNNLATKHLRQLKYLRIILCERMEEIFTIDNDTSGNSSSFEGINYEEMDYANSIVLRSLEELYLGDMEKLKVFSAKNSSHGGQQAFFGEQVQLPKLKYMVMCRLPSCEKIWESHHPKGSFGQLRILDISDCKELRNIFPAAVARGLVQLLLLSISECDKLEEVVVVESRNDAEEAEEEDSRIIFPQLGCLQLSNLQSLRSFCSARCSTMEFPSLNCVMIEGNIKMERFSYGSLHTPKLRGQDSLNTIVARKYEDRKRAMGSESSESDVGAS